MNTQSSLEPTLHTLDYTPPRSSISPSFWSKLYELKLNNLKLDSSDITIVAPIKSKEFFTENQCTSEVLTLEFTEESFCDSVRGVKGVLVNVNTIEVSLRIFTSEQFSNNNIRSLKISISNLCLIVLLEVSGIVSWMDLHLRIRHC